MATVRGILSNPTYTGTIYANRTRVRAAQVRRSATHPIGRPRDSQVPLPPEEWVAVATVPAIVTREQFDRVQARIAANRSFARRNNTVTDYLLRALVTCGSCRLACQARRTMPTGKTYYICTGKNLQVRHRLGCTCPSKFIPAGVLDELVWSDLSDLLRHPDRVARALGQVGGGMRVAARIAGPSREPAARAVEPGPADRAADRGVPERGRVAGRVPTTAEGAGTPRRHPGDPGGVALGRGEPGAGDQRAPNFARSFAERVRVGLDTATFERRRQLVELLIDRVVVTGDDVEIRYAFPIGPAGESGRFCHLRVDYLGAQTSSGAGRVELPVQEVLGHRRRWFESVVHRTSAPSCRHARSTHQLRHRVPRRLLAPHRQFDVDARAAVAGLHLAVDGLDRAHQGLACALRPGAHRPSPPAV